MEEISLAGYHGDNIKLQEDNQIATWNHTYSGGIVFSQTTLRTGDSFHIEIIGNGHTSIGFVQTDPKCIMCLKDAVLKGRVRFMTNVRTLEKAGIVKIKKLESSVSLCYGGCCLEEDIDPRSPVWVVINIKFGSVQSRICKYNYMFDKFKFYKKNYIEQVIQLLKCIAACPLVKAASVAYIALALSAQSRWFDLQSGQVSD